MAHDYIARWSVIVALNLAVVAPLALIAKAHRRMAQWSLMGLAALMFAVDIALLLLPRVGPFLTLSRNWQGQLLSMSFWLAWIRFAPFPSRHDAGLVARVPRRALIDALVVALLAVWSTNLLDLVRGPHIAKPVEEVLFSATMPGISEELLYRGVLLAVLNRAFGRPWKLFGASFGWGLVISSVLFISLHFFRTDSHGHVSMYLDAHDMGGIALAGVALCWIRERTGSLWPGIIVHNVANLFS